MSPGDVVRIGSRRAGRYAARQLGRVVGYTRSAASTVLGSGRSDRIDWSAADVKACLVSVDWGADWAVDHVWRPPVGAAAARSRRPGALDGLADPATVLVARDAGSGAVAACGFVVDRDLGVTSVVSPRILNDRQHALFTRTFFAGSRRLPLTVSLPVAHRIVYDGIRRARAFGCQPAPGFEEARRMLDSPARSRRDRARIGQLPAAVGER